jgi:hypothetical protein
MRAETEEEAQRRESGLPGGGKARIDETGTTGVYPASGPLPEGEAEVRPMASWGQGERGAAGYEDHGDAEPPSKADYEAMGTPPAKATPAVPEGSSAPPR